MEMKEHKNIPPQLFELFRVLSLKHGKKQVELVENVSINILGRDLHAEKTEFLGIRTSERLFRDCCPIRSRLQVVENNTLDELSLVRDSW